MAKRNYKKQYRQAKATAKQLKKAPKWVIAVALILVVVLVGGYFLYTKVFKKEEQFIGDSWDTEIQTAKTPVVIDGKALSIHFLELGNENAGDCTYIRAGDTDILVDAGSYYDSIDTIVEYIGGYMDDDVLEYVIATHAHEDHIACFSGKNGSETIFALYKCQTIIDFPQTKSTSAVYNRYITNRQNEVTNDGATHYTALQCWKGENGANRSYELYNDGDGYTIELNILYQKFYEETASTENDYSVCFTITETQNENVINTYLFTGDLEEAGERSLVENKVENKLGKVKVFKAGHHGSSTSTNECLLEIIDPDIVCVCCCAGSVEYSQNLSNSFPTQEFIDRVAPYTDAVYVNTRVNIKFNEEKNKYYNDGEYKFMNGDIVVMSDKNAVTVKCSYNDLLLKDTEWFKNRRVCPQAWK